MEASKHEEELLAEALLLQEELGVDLAEHVLQIFIFILKCTTYEYIIQEFQYCFLEIVFRRQNYNIFSHFFLIL